MTAEAVAPLKQLLTAEEVAIPLAIDAERVWALTREKKLRAVKFGPRTYRYDPRRVAEDLEKLEE